MPAGQRNRNWFHLTGQVQGVGFRPYVYRLATSLKLTGFVHNDASGAIIEVQGPAEAIEDFARRLAPELPPLAQVADCSRQDRPVVNGEAAFEIHASEGGELIDAQVTVDTATCPDCIREMMDSADPRHRYPFINCTNCGPRYSIIKRIPYDRPSTTMADFAMCSYCGRQYADPLNRRFHAQPIACPKCGPGVWLVDAQGKQIVCEDAVAEAAAWLLRGRIVAIKGLGGFHLACRADDEHAVRRLRMRKSRDAKPLAVMVRDLAQARRLCKLDDSAGELLSGVQRPIVLLPRRVVSLTRGPGGSGLACEPVAPGLDSLGIMLPYTPLHHLLFAQGLPPLVMTSGNVSDEPLVRENDDAIAHLGRIADVLLLHNRRIQRSIDDSVVQWRSGGAHMVIRRARGYAPRPVILGSTGVPPVSRSMGVPPMSPTGILPVEDTENPGQDGREHGQDAHATHGQDARATRGRDARNTILAVGGELKNTVCLYRAGRAVISEHVGDLKDGGVYRHFMQVIHDLETLFDLRPDMLACDLHPQYLSTQYAQRRSAGRLAGRPPLPMIGVQHHHAHAVACLAENGHEGPAIGIVCDGAGLGEDGAVWGCEIMKDEAGRYERLGHLKYCPSPGGDAAAIDTRRPAIALLLETFARAGSKFTDLDLATKLWRDELRPAEELVAAVVEQIAVGANCPPTSSLGRLFDGVSALCGLAGANRYEGEAPMLLEASAAADVTRGYPIALTFGEPFEIDYRPMIEAIVWDLQQGLPASVVSAKFHNTVAAFLAASARRARELTGLEVVALSGGCFANRLLSARLEELLAQEKFKVLTHRMLPCNDGCLSLGQAVVAARLMAQETETARHRDTEAQR
jgi:hydrogenase maturation protein HypF